MMMAVHTARAAAVVTAHEGHGKVGVPLPQLNGQRAEVGELTDALPEGIVIDEGTPAKPAKNGGTKKNGKSGQAKKNGAKKGGSSKKDGPKKRNGGAAG